MKLIPASIIFLLLSGAVLAQKSEVEVITSKELNAGVWSITGSNYQTLFEDTCTPPGDTVRFSAASETLYYLKVIIPESEFSDSVLLTLLVNNIPVLKLEKNLKPGEHLLPFYTGLRHVPDKIVGGTSALISDFPWQVYVQSGTYMCGGSIIAKDWILTAAHCVNGISPINVLIKAGATDPFNAAQGKIYQVAQIIVKDYYDPITLENDLALLKLKTEINLVNAKPVRLMKPEDVEEGATVPGVMTWVTGWGLTGVNPETYPSVLQKVELPIVSNSVASVVWKQIPDNTIMAGYRTASKDACSGDSGGPMVVNVNGEYRQAGIVSWGSALCNTYSGFTQVSSFVSWIEMTTLKFDFIPPVPIGNNIICPGENSTQYNIPAVLGATAYFWEVVPASAGSITGNTNNATAVWNNEYSGDARVKVRVVVGGVLSEWARYDIRLARATAINIGPVSDSICVGTNKTFNISTDGSDLNFKWSKNGEILYSGIKEDYDIINASASDQGIYRCEVSGLCGTVNSDQADITVLPLTKIISGTPDTTAHFGSDLSLKVKTEGHNLKYSWSRNGETIINRTTPVLSFQNVGLNNIGLYNVKVTGSCGTRTSNNIYLYITSSDAGRETEVKIWPTLFSDIINIAPSNDDLYTILIYNSSGVKIRELKNCRNNTTVNMHNNSPGLYFVTAYNINYRITARVIKK